MSERVGLTTLVERACRKLICGDVLEEVAGSTEASDEAPVARVAWKRIESYVFQICWKHNVGRIRREDRAWVDGFDETIVDLGMPLDAFEELLCGQLDSSPCWNSFCRSIDEIPRIDDFLFTFESDRRCRHLARDCRDDLALLHVLADWCEDHDRPVAAAEARHLGALVASILRE